MFKLDEYENTKLAEFRKEHDKGCKFFDDGTAVSPPGGAIGGRLTYSFTPTSLGTAVQVECACGAKANLTNYGDW